MSQLTDFSDGFRRAMPARDALFAAAYAELHRSGATRLRHGGRNTVLDTTCLVHESYLRFVRAGRAACRGPARLLRLRVPSDAFGDRQ